MEYTMSLIEAIEQRHSVRSFEERPIAAEAVEALNEAIREYNAAGDLNMQLITDAPTVFDNLFAKFLKFSGANNYIALIGESAPDLEERCGYYGEKLVLLAQQLGLNTCWVGGSYKKNKTEVTMEAGEKQVLVIAIGYGKNQGRQHKGKSMTDVSGESDVSRDVPNWYKRGVNAALLAPTAVNQQKFSFERYGNKVRAKAGAGPFAKVDLGIVKCHFEIGAGTENFEWM